MSHNVKIPIKVGLQAKYDNMQHESSIIYVCCDSGNMYLGDTPIGGNTGVLFYARSPIPKDFGSDGQRCITPDGIYEKSTDTSEWQLYSRWSITDKGELAVDGSVPVASVDKLGFVRSSNEIGKVAVDNDGTMSVNGWDDIEVSLNYVYRSE